MPSNLNSLLQRLANKSFFVVASFIEKLINSIQQRLASYRREYYSFPEAQLTPEGSAGVKLLGHRTYVGGLWDQIGNHQFKFLLDRGLQPEHILLDIACGALRLGVKVIPYLQPEHYLGVEKESLLLERGLQQELGAELAERFRPKLLNNSDFAFELLATSIDVAIAQSLFTHLPPAAIKHCLQQLRPWLKSSGVFYATFFKSTSIQRRSLRKAHDHACFFYTIAEMNDFGIGQGYTVEYIGDWGHPRQQVMVAYRLKPQIDTTAAS